MSEYVITSFYKFVEIKDVQGLKPQLIKLMKDNNVFGTIIIADEGINSTVAASRDDMNRFYEFFRNDDKLHDIWFKETFDDFIPFDRVKVKIRPEIVTLGVKGVSPTKSVGTYLSPEKWHEMISKEDVIVLDTRNDYEYNLGTFENAKNPNTENFREFPKYVQENLMDSKDKPIAMFCTGGIRCEKSTALLKDLGFKEVYHLEGGVLNYFDKIDPKESKWQGTCFVFDDRIAVAHE